MYSTAPIDCGHCIMDARKKKPEKLVDGAPPTEKPTFMASPTNQGKEDEYLEKLTESIVIAFVLALIIKAGFFLRDYFF